MGSAPTPGGPAPSELPAGGGRGKGLGGNPTIPEPPEPSVTHFRFPARGGGIWCQAAPGSWRITHRPLQEESNPVTPSPGRRAAAGSPPRVQAAPSSDGRSLTTRPSFRAAAGPGFGETSPRFLAGGGSTPVSTRPRICSLCLNRCRGASWQPPSGAQARVTAPRLRTAETQSVSDPNIIFIGC